MTKQIRRKQERCIEAVREGLEGDGAVAFIHDCGFAMTESAMTRHLQTLGGRDAVSKCIDENMTNVEILSLHFSGEDFSELNQALSQQGDLFVKDAKSGGTIPFSRDSTEEFETTKITLSIPSDLYQALRMASKAEGKNKTQLIVEILTMAMSRLPAQSSDEETGEAM